MKIFRWDFLVATFRNGMGFTDQLAIETAVPGEDFNHVSSSRSSVRALVRLVAERSRAGRPSLYSEEDCASGDRHRDTVRGRRVTLREGGRSPFSSEAGEGVPTLNVAKYATFYMGHPAPSAAVRARGLAPRTCRGGCPYASKIYPRLGW